LNTNEIIDTYKPHNGFFDLSDKPKDLNKRTYAKILKVQTFLMEQNKNIEYLKQPFNRLEFQKLQQLSADLQGIILKHWNY
jgi:hypothetical protein